MANTTVKIQNRGLAEVAGPLAAEEAELQPRSCCLRDDETNNRQTREVDASQCLPEGERLIRQMRCDMRRLKGRESTARCQRLCRRDRRGTIKGIMKRSLEIAGLQIGTA